MPTMRRSLALGCAAACMTAAVFGLSACPRTCTSDAECNSGEVCVVAGASGQCQPAGPPPPPPPPDDAGAPGDAGSEETDAGEDRDAGNEDVDAGDPDVDAGDPGVDAGDPDVDAGPPVPLKLRGALEVAPGVLRDAPVGGSKALKGRILSPGAVTSSGGTLKLESGAAPP